MGAQLTSRRGWRDSFDVMCQQGSILNNNIGDWIGGAPVPNFTTTHEDLSVCEPYGHICQTWNLFQGCGGLTHKEIP